MEYSASTVYDEVVMSLWMKMRRSGGPERLRQMRCVFPFLSLLGIREADETTVR